MLPYNFGLEQYLGLGLWCAGILAFLLSVFWRPVIGIYYLIPLIPLQTTRYRMLELPLGQSVVNIILLGVALGLLRHRKGILPKTPWTFLICLYGLYTFACLFLDTNNLVPRMREWWDLMTMPVLFFLVTATIEDVRGMKIAIALMCLAVLVMDKSFWNAISDRDFSTFSRDLQEGGAMGYAGVQGMAAFNAQYAWFLVALVGGKQTRLVRLAYLGLALFAANCVMYTFGRGGYVAFLAGWLFLGFVKHHKLLVLLIMFGLTWASLVPNAVRERVLMTYDPNERALDHSAEVRLELWDDAVDLFYSSPVVGSGFNTYAYMQRLYNYGDTHNIYLKVLVETGVVGGVLFLWLLGKAFRMGFVLFRGAQNPFFSALGLALAVWIVCTAVANLFGDRWTHLQINGYLWVLAGFVARALAIESSRAEAKAPVVLTSVTAERQLAAV